MPRALARLLIVSVVFRSNMLGPSYAFAGEIEKH